MHGRPVAVGSAAKRGVPRGADNRPDRLDRARKSLGSATTFAEDLADPEGIEAGVAAMASEVWRWCERTGARGRTVNRHR